MLIDKCVWRSTRQQKTIETEAKYDQTEGNDERKIKRLSKEYDEERILPWPLTLRVS